ncbi:MAG: alpha/beta fold hydrolase, partial [Woeseia sp.]|nr:alpha/beta fold hydrolase [Woeseia sp.]
MSSVRRKIALTAAVTLTVMIVVALWSWPSTPSLALDVPIIDAAPDGWLAANETLIEAEFGIFAASEKRVRWQVGAAGKQTDFSVVYLHGFSATRQEIAPVSQRLADALGANLYETRLAGHGLKTHKLENVTAEDWLADTAEAIAVGRRIGKRIILIGTSTGATLALAAATSRPEDIAALVLISPNFSPRDKNADAMLWPGGPLLARLTLGGTLSWEPSNAMQERFWTTEYPLAAVIEVMRLVKAIRLSLPLTLQ